MNTSISELNIGDILGSGKIIAKLGSDQIGTVFKIHCSELGVFRAVKIVNASFPSDILAELEAELKIPAQLKHPLFVQTYNAGTVNALPYIEMEFIEGPSLTEIIAHKEPLPLELCTAVGILLCDAIEYLHRFEYAVDTTGFKSLLHLNIKPSNVFLCLDGSLKITDAGPVTASINLTAHINEPGVESVFIAPELLHSHSATTASDVYAIGKLLVALSCSTNKTALSISEIKHAEPVLTKKMPRAFLDLLEATTAQDPQERVHSAFEFRACLEKIHRDSSKLTPKEVISDFLHGEDFMQHRKASGIPHLAFWTALVIVGLGGAGYLGSRFFPGIIGRPSSSAVAMVPVNDSASSNTSHTTTSAEKPIAPAPGLSSAAPKQQTGQNDSTDFFAHENEPSDALSTKKSFLNMLREHYATSDLSIILAGELAKKNFIRATKICDSLTPVQRNKPEIILYQIRAYQGCNAKSKLRKLFAATSLNDAELYLAKAQFQLFESQISAALQSISLCKSAPALLSDKKIIEKSALYTEALCLSKIVNISPTDANKQAALEKWFTVKSSFRDNQASPYFIEANEKIRIYSQAE